MMITRDGDKKHAFISSSSANFLNQSHLFPSLPTDLWYPIILYNTSCEDEVDNKTYTDIPVLSLS